ncbi:phage integrase central domain-containing protein [Paraburkholderia sprentiae]|uniref:phage integrase central domain-containing protein n=1 Tax=Paraburkholderia sprentiae TaxID=948107 RepID=UPI003899F999
MYRKAEFAVGQYFLRPLRDKPVSTLATSEVKPVLEGIAIHAPNLATKARQYVGGIVTYAIYHDLREDGVPLSLRGVIPRHKKGHIPGDHEARRDCPASPSHQCISVANHEGRSEADHVHWLTPRGSGHCTLGRDRS